MIGLGGSFLLVAKNLSFLPQPDSSSTLGTLGAHVEGDVVVMIGFGRLIITNKWIMRTSSKKEQKNKGVAPSKVGIQTNPFPVLRNQEAGWSFKLQIKV
jgi:hypothetical protein